MREALEHVIRNAILFEYALPNLEQGIEKSCISSQNQNDICLNNSNSQEISKIIYNGIVEFAINEFRIDCSQLQKEQLRVIHSRIRYREDARADVKLKYGFFGEVLLDLILRVFLGTRVLIARGYFYSPIEKSEVKGFDAFHLMERDGKTELWFGEAKFYESPRKAITSVLEKIATSLSDEFLDKNLLAIITEADNISNSNDQFSSLLEAWRDNPRIALPQEIANREMRLVYPIFIAYQKNKTDHYHQSIKSCIEYIASECLHLKISISASFDYRLFFIFLPLADVKQIKETVLKWIDSQEPLI